MRIASGGDFVTGIGQCWSDQTKHGMVTVQEKGSSSRQSTLTKIGSISKRLDLERVLAGKKVRGSQEHVT